MLNVCKLWLEKKYNAYNRSTITFIHIIFICSQKNPFFCQQALIRQPNEEKKTKKVHSAHAAIRLNNKNKTHKEQRKQQWQQ